MLGWMGQVITDSNNLHPYNRGLKRFPSAAWARILHFNSVFPPLAGFNTQMILWLFWETLTEIRMGQKIFFDIQPPPTFLISPFTFLHLATCLWHFQVQSVQNTSKTTLLWAFLSWANPFFPLLPGNPYPIICGDLKKILPFWWSFFPPLLYRSAHITLYICLLEWLL